MPVIAPSSRTWMPLRLSRWHWTSVVAMSLELATEWTGVDMTSPASSGGCATRSAAATTRSSSSCGSSPLTIADAACA